MAEFLNRQAYQTAATRAGTEVYDQGLRSYMLGIYNYMAAGIALSGLVAYLIFSMAVTGDPSLAAAKMRNGVMLTQFGAQLFGSPLYLVVAFAPLAMLLIASFMSGRMSPGATQLFYWVFTATMGASLSAIFIRYTLGSITQIFMVTAATFAALSLYGYTTKRDLSGWGTFLMMGLIGVVIASIVNIFLQSPALQFAFSVIGVLVFAGLTAYDNQRLKDEYYMVGGDQAAMQTSSVWGALSLYLNFVNLFQLLLSLFGNRE
jgi:FtsH-binding integral membrane protein